MSAIHTAARRLVGILNDAAGAGIEISEYGRLGYFDVADGKLTLVVLQDKNGKWEVEDR